MAPGTYCFSTFISESYYPCFDAVFYIRKRIIAFQFAILFFTFISEI